MIHPNTEMRFINNNIGYGVFATAFIPKGTIMWVFDKLDREISRAEVETLGEPYRDLLDRYCYISKNGNYLLCWDHNRFVNHSFEPNFLTTAYGLELAIRDIQKNEELKCDYGTLNILEPFQAFDEGHERKTIYPDDLRRYHKVWDEQLVGAFKFLNKVEQPLKKLITPELWEKLVRVAQGKEEMASILNHFYSPVES